MTGTLAEQLSEEYCLRRLFDIWPQYHQAMIEREIARSLSDAKAEMAWLPRCAELERRIRRICGHLGIEPISCPRCGTLIRNLDAEVLRRNGMALPFDPETPRLEGFEE